MYNCSWKITTYTVSNNFMVVIANLASILDFWVVVQMNRPWASSRGPSTLACAVVHAHKVTWVVGGTGCWVEDLDTIDFVHLPLLSRIEASASLGHLGDGCSRC